MTTRNSYRDDTLIKEFNEGSPRAFKVIFDQYYGAIYFFTRKLTNDDEEASDITSMTFAKLFNISQNFDSQTNIRAFLYITARNACFNYLKSKKVQRKKLNELASSSELETEDVSIFEIKTQEEIKAAFLRRLAEAIEKLPPKRRRVLHMVLEGWTIQEIAKMLNLSIHSVNNHKSYALRDLRNLVESRDLKLIYIMAILFLK